MPNTDYPEKTKHEGFWAADPDKIEVFPFPKPNIMHWIEKDEFIKKLTIVENKARKNTYKGFSRCRICKIPNGSITYTYSNWRWPSGFKHYIKQHNIKPSQEFISFIYHNS